MNKEQLKIFEENTGLIGYCIKKKFAGVTVMDNEDLYQIGCIGLVKAIETFDTSKEIKFSSYAFTCIYREIVTEIGKSGATIGTREEKRKNYKGNIGNFTDLDANNTNKNGEVIPVTETFTVPVGINEEIELQDKVQDSMLLEEIYGYIDQMTGDKRKVMQMYAQGYTIAEITKIMKLPYEKVRSIYLSATRTLRRLVEGKKVKKGSLTNEKVEKKSKRKPKKYINLNEELVRRSKELGITKRQYIEDYLHLSEQCLQKWMRNDTEPERTNKERVSKALGMSIEYLFEINGFYKEAV